MQIRIYNSQLNRNAPLAGAEMSAQAAGAGIGQAMQAAGNSLKALAENRERQRQALEVDKDLSNLQMSYHQKVLQAQEAAADGAPDMTAGIMKEFANDSEKLTKGKSPFYNQYASYRLGNMKSNIFNQSLNYQVQAERQYKVKLTDDIISNKAAYVRNNPAEFDKTLEDVYHSIDISGLPQAERERQKENARVNLAVSQIERRLEDEPAKLAKDLRGGIYHDKLPVPSIERYINAADRAAVEGQNTNVYSIVYEGHRGEDGELDFKAAMKDLYDPVYQSKLGIGSKQADSVADLIYAKFTREKAVKENNQRENQLTDINKAVDLSINGDPINAIALIKKSENINGEKKISIIKALKEDKLNKVSSPEVFNDFATRIAAGQNIPETEIMQEVAAGRLNFSDKDNFLKMQKQMNEPKKAVYDLAIKQVDKAMSKGLMYSYTPAEAEAIARAKRRIMNVYSEALVQGKSLTDIQNILSSENITRIISDNKPSIREILDSMIASMTKKAKASEKIPQRQPGESVDDYSARTD